MIVDLYGKEWCSYCNRAKDLLTERGQEYIYHDVEKVEWELLEMKRKAPGASTVPQIFIDGEHVGGFDQLRAWYKAKDAEAAATASNDEGLTE